MADQPASLGRKIVAAVLDFFFVFLGGGIAIANFTGETTEGGFALEGTSALILFALIAAYFVIGNRIGGTIFQRVLRTRR